MAHEIDMTTGTAAFAFTGERAWHGLGNELPEGTDLDTWAEKAGYAFNIKKAPLEYSVPVTNGEDGEYDTYETEERVVLYRDDTNGYIGTVSPNYNVHQPKDILEFFRDLVEGEETGFSMETAGILKDGKRCFALAKAKSGGINLTGSDKVLPYLLLTTANDGTSATIGRLTTIRVVCKNTLDMSAMADGQTQFSIRHSSAFDATKMRSGLAAYTDQFDSFIRQAGEFQKVQVSDAQAIDIITRLYDRNASRDLKEGPMLTLDHKVSGIARGVIDKALEAVKNSPGADLEGSRGTLWGLVNGVTYLEDHEYQARGEDKEGNRLWSANMGQGAKRKLEVVEMAKQLVA